MIYLYSYFRSSCSYRVRIALNLKKLDFEYIPIHLVNNGGEQFKESYRLINPKCEVPTLKIDGISISQSVAIIEYLEETRKENGQIIIPDCPKLRAKMRIIVELINSGIQPIQNLVVLMNIKKFGGDHLLWAKDAIETGFNALEAILNESAGKYCINDKITMADVFLVPQVYNAKKFNVDMSKYPIINRINDELVKHPAFEMAHPEKQTDASS